MKDQPAGKEVNLMDGLYQVTTRYLCAGFVVRGNNIIYCAPILVNKISYWVTVAKIIDKTINNE